MSLFGTGVSPDEKYDASEMTRKSTPVATLDARWIPVDALALLDGVADQVMVPVHCGTKTKGTLLTRFGFEGKPIF